MKLICLGIALLLSSPPRKQAHDGGNVMQLLGDSCTRKWAGGDMFLFCFDGNSMIYAFQAMSDYRFPAEQHHDTIRVYWNRTALHSPDSSIEKHLNLQGAPKHGELFMELYMEKDANLRARYLHPDWIARFNRASRPSLRDSLGYFPDRFSLVDF